MHNELHTLTSHYTDLEQAPGLVTADQHDEIIEIKDPDWVAVGVEHVVVTDPVLAGTCQDHRIYGINLP